MANDPRYRFAVVIPTYRETEAIERLFESWHEVDSIDFKLVVVNANPDDSTSELIQRYRESFTIEEVATTSDSFWAQSVQQGLQHIAHSNHPCNYIIIQNCDIQFDANTLRGLVRSISQRPNDVLALQCLDKEHKLPVSSAVIVKSWCLSRNHHIFTDLTELKNNRDDFVEATMLPTRFLSMPRSVIDKAGYPNFAKLPHYSSDYEYTNRMRLKGFNLYLLPKLNIYVNSENTGLKPSSNGHSLFKRLKLLNEIRSPINYKYRYNFVRLTYPKYALAVGMLTHFLKLSVEIILGHRITRIR